MSDLLKQSKQTVTPFEATTNNGQFNYQQLIKDFGVDEITDDILVRFEKVTGQKPHVWLKRKIFFAHRELDKILDSYEKKEPIFIYTGRGPSNASLHIGHLIPMMFTKWLQDVLNANVIIQIADDEKYFFSLKNTPFDDIYKQGFENAKDIIAIGFDPEKTFIFSNRDYSNTPCYNKVFNDIMKNTNINKIQAIFGIKPAECVGKLVWPIWQTAASFSQSFEHIFKNNKARCLVAYAIDQDPYFRMARDVAPKLDYLKPCSIMCTFLPALKGNGKMSTSSNQHLIYLTDTPEQVSKKIKKHAFSGGRQTLEEQRELGGILDVDISYQYLTYFEFDDAKLKEIANDFSSGKMTCSEIKMITSEIINKIIKQIKDKRDVITDDILKKFYL